MVEISFIFIELLFTAVWILCRLIVWLRQKRIDWKRELVLLLMFVNIAVILRFTFLPLFRVDGKIQPLVFNRKKALRFKLNLIPFVNLLDYKSKKLMFANLIGNVLLFIPSGIVLPSLYRTMNRFWKVLLVGGIISLSVEILQLPFRVRTTDIDDLILNVLGVMIGYGIYALARKRRSFR